MEKIYYNKLCRDKVPDIIHAKGFECEVRTVSKEEFRREIVRKIYEEASGVSQYGERTQLLKELADLVITLDTLSKEFGISEEELDAAVSRSLEEKGGYNKNFYLTWSSDTEYRSTDAHHGFDD